MEELQKNLLDEILLLKKYQAEASRELDDAPEGSLRIARNKNTEQYYHRIDEKDTNGVYIKKANQELIRGLAQKDYNKKLIGVLSKKICSLEKLSTVCAKDDITEIYEQLSTERQKLVKPCILPEQDYVNWWKQEQYQLIEAFKKKNYGKENRFKAESLEIITENKEYVRSKSEKILADKFYLMQIPYVYEVPLYLEGYGYVHPDFKVLNKRTRKEFYWEHLGLMGQEEYCLKAIKKIEQYEKNHIFPGKNLILTYETESHPLNMKSVELLIKEYLL